MPLVGSITIHENRRLKKKSDEEFDGKSSLIDVEDSIFERPKLTPDQSFLEADEELKKIAQEADDIAREFSLSVDIPTTEQKEVEKVKKTLKKVLQDEEVKRRIPETVLEDIKEKLEEAQLLSKEELPIPDKVFEESVAEEEELPEESRLTEELVLKETRYDEAKEDIITPQDTDIRITATAVNDLSACVTGDIPEMESVVIEEEIIRLIDLTTPSVIVDAKEETITLDEENAEDIVGTSSINIEQEIEEHICVDEKQTADVTEPKIMPAIQKCEEILLEIHELDVDEMPEYEFSEEYAHEVKEGIDEKSEAIVTSTKPMPPIQEAEETLKTYKDISTQMPSTPCVNVEYVHKRKICVEEKLSVKSTSTRVMFKVEEPKEKVIDHEEIPQASLEYLYTRKIEIDETLTAKSTCGIIMPPVQGSKEEKLNIVYYDTKEIPETTNINVEYASEGKVDEKLGAESTRAKLMPKVEEASENTVKVEENSVEELLKTDNINIKCACQGKTEKDEKLTPIVTSIKLMPPIKESKEVSITIPKDITEAIPQPPVVSFEYVHQIKACVEEKMSAKFTAPRVMPKVSESKQDIMNLPERIAREISERDKGQPQHAYEQITDDSNKFTAKATNIKLMPPIKDPKETSLTIAKDIIEELLQTPDASFQYAHEMKACVEEKLSAKLTAPRDMPKVRESKQETIEVEEDSVKTISETDIGQTQHAYQQMTDDSSKLTAKSTSMKLMPPIKESKEVTITIANDITEGIPQTAGVSFEYAHEVKGCFEEKLSAKFSAPRVMPKVVESKPEVIKVQEHTTEDISQTDTSQSQHAHEQINDESNKLTAKSTSIKLMPPVKEPQEVTVTLADDITEAIPQTAGVSFEYAHEVKGCFEEKLSAKFTAPRVMPKVRESKQETIEVQEDSVKTIFETDKEPPQYANEQITDGSNKLTAKATSMKLMPPIKESKEVSVTIANDITEGIPQTAGVSFEYAHEVRGCFEETLSAKFLAPRVMPKVVESKQEVIEDQEHTVEDISQTDKGQSQHAYEQIIDESNKLTANSTSIKLMPPVKESQEVTVTLADDITEAIPQTAGVSFEYAHEVKGCFEEKLSAKFTAPRVMPKVRESKQETIEVQENSVKMISETDKGQTHHTYQQMTDDSNKLTAKSTSIKLMPPVKEPQEVTVTIADDITEGIPQTAVVSFEYAHEVKGCFEEKLSAKLSAPRVMPKVVVSKQEVIEDQEHTVEDISQTDKCQSQHAYEQIIDDSNKLTAKSTSMKLMPPVKESQEVTVTIADQITDAIPQTASISFEYAHEVRSCFEDKLSAKFTAPRVMPKVIESKQETIEVQEDSVKTIFETDKEPSQHANEQITDDSSKLTAKSTSIKLMPPIKESKEVTITIANDITEGIPQTAGVSFEYAHEVKGCFEEKLSANFSAPRVMPQVAESKQEAIEVQEHTIEDISETDKIQSQHAYEQITDDSYKLTAKSTSIKLMPPVKESQEVTLTIADDITEATSQTAGVSFEYAHEVKGCFEEKLSAKFTAPRVMPKVRESKQETIEVQEDSVKTIFETDKEPLQYANEQITDGSNKLTAKATSMKLMPPIKESKEVSVTIADDITEGIPQTAGVSFEYAHEVKVCFEEKLSAKLTAPRVMPKVMESKQETIEVQENIVKTIPATALQHQVTLPLVWEAMEKQETVDSEMAEEIPYTANVEYAREGKLEYDEKVFAKVNVQRIMSGTISTNSLQPETELVSVFDGTSQIIETVEEVGVIDIHEQAAEIMVETHEEISPRVWRTSVFLDKETEKIQTIIIEPKEEGVVITSENISDLQMTERISDQHAVEDSTPLDDKVSMKSANVLQDIMSEQISPSKAVQEIKTVSPNIFERKSAENIQIETQPAMSENLSIRTVEMQVTETVDVGLAQDKVPLTEAIKTIEGSSITETAESILPQTVIHDKYSVVEKIPEIIEVSPQVPQQYEEKLEADIKLHHEISSDGVPTEVTKEISEKLEQERVIEDISKVTDISNLDASTKATKILETITKEKIQEPLSESPKYGKKESTEVAREFEVKKPQLEKGKLDIVTSVKELVKLEEKVVSQAIESSVKVDDTSTIKPLHEKLVTVSEVHVAGERLIASSSKKVSLLHEPPAEQLLEKKVIEKELTVDKEEIAVLEQKETPKADEAKSVVSVEKQAPVTVSKPAVLEELVEQLLEKQVIEKELTVDKEEVAVLEPKETPKADEPKSVVSVEKETPVTISIPAVLVKPVEQLLEKQVVEEVLTVDKEEAAVLEQKETPKADEAKSVVSVEKETPVTVSIPAVLVKPVEQLLENKVIEKELTVDKEEVAVLEQKETPKADEAKSVVSVEKETPVTVSKPAVLEELVEQLLEKQVIEEVLTVDKEEVTVLQQKETPKADEAKSVVSVEKETPVTVSKPAVLEEPVEQLLEKQVIEEVLTVDKEEVAVLEQKEAPKVDEATIVVSVAKETPVTVSKPAVMEEPVEQLLEKKAIEEELTVDKEEVAVLEQKETHKADEAKSMVSVEKETSVAVSKPSALEEPVKQLLEEKAIEEVLVLKVDKEEVAVLELKETPKAEAKIVVTVEEETTLTVSIPNGFEQPTHLAQGMQEVIPDSATVDLETLERTLSYQKVSEVHDVVDRLLSKGSRTISLLREPPVEQLREKLVIDKDLITAIEVVNPLEQGNISEIGEATMSTVTKSEENLVTIDKATTLLEPSGLLTESEGAQEDMPDMPTVALETFDEKLLHHLATEVHIPEEKLLPSVSETISLLHKSPLIQLEEREVVEKEISTVAEETTTFKEEISEGGEVIKSTVTEVENTLVTVSKLTVLHEPKPVVNELEGLQEHILENTSEVTRGFEESEYDHTFAASIVVDEGLEHGSLQSSATLLHPLHKQQEEISVVITQNLTTNINLEQFSKEQLVVGALVTPESVTQEEIAPHVGIKTETLEPVVDRETATREVVTAIDFASGKLSKVKPSGVGKESAEVHPLETTEYSEKLAEEVLNIREDIFNDAMRSSIIALEETKKIVPVIQGKETSDETEIIYETVQSTITVQPQDTLIIQDESPSIVATKSMENIEKPEQEGPKTIGASVLEHQTVEEKFIETAPTTDTLFYTQSTVIDSEEVDFKKPEVIPEVRAIESISKLDKRASVKEPSLKEMAKVLELGSEHGIRSEVTVDQLTATPVSMVTEPKEVGSDKIEARTLTKDTLPAIKSITEDTEVVQIEKAEVRPEARARESVSKFDKRASVKEPSLTEMAKVLELGSEHGVRSEVTVDQLTATPASMVTSPKEVGSDRIEARTLTKDTLPAIKSITEDTEEVHIEKAEVRPEARAKESVSKFDKRASVKEPSLKEMAKVLELGSEHGVRTEVTVDRVTATPTSMVTGPKEVGSDKIEARTLTKDTLPAIKSITEDTEEVHIEKAEVRPEARARESVSKFDKRASVKEPSLKEMAKVLELGSEHGVRTEVTVDRVTATPTSMVTGPKEVGSDKIEARTLTKDTLPAIKSITEDTEELHIEKTEVRPEARARESVSKFDKRAFVKEASLKEMGKVLELGSNREVRTELAIANTSGVATFRTKPKEIVFDKIQSTQQSSVVNQKGMMSVGLSQLTTDQSLLLTKEAKDRAEMMCAETETQPRRMAAITINGTEKPCLGLQSAYAVVKTEETCMPLRKEELKRVENGNLGKETTHKTDSLHEKLEQCKTGSLRTSITPALAVEEQLDDQMAQCLARMETIAALRRSFECNAKAEEISECKTQALVLANGKCNTEEDSCKSAMFDECRLQIAKQGLQLETQICKVQGRETLAYQKPRSVYPCVEKGPCQKRQSKRHKINLLDKLNLFGIEILSMDELRKLHEEVIKQVCSLLGSTNPDECERPTQLTKFIKSLSFDRLADLHNKISKVGREKFMRTNPQSEHPIFTSIPCNEPQKKQASCRKPDVVAKCYCKDKNFNPYTVLSKEVVTKPSSMKQRKYLCSPKLNALEKCYCKRMNADKSGAYRTESVSFTKPLKNHQENCYCKCKTNVPNVAGKCKTNAPYMVGKSKTNVPNVAGTKHLYKDMNFDPSEFCKCIFKKSCKDTKSKTKSPKQVQNCGQSIVEKLNLVPTKNFKHPSKATACSSVNKSISETNKLNQLATDILKRKCIKNFV